MYVPGDLARMGYSQPPCAVEKVAPGHQNWKAATNCN